MEITIESRFKKFEFVQRILTGIEIIHVIKNFPFRIKIVRTDNGHEFQARFHWYCLDKGIGHVYIKPASPRLNGKV